MSPVTVTFRRGDRVRLTTLPAGFQCRLAIGHEGVVVVGGDEDQGWHMTAVVFDGKNGGRPFLLSTRHLPLVARASAAELEALDA
jgi:hypothetical protein